MKLIKENGLYVVEARAHADMNPKISAYEALRKYKDDPDIYISFTELEKVGIFPMSGFNTPNGLYTYPLKEIWKIYHVDQVKSVGKAVPFAGNRLHIQVLRLKNKKGFVEDMYKDYTSRDYDNDIIKIKKMFADVSDDVKKTFQFFKQDLKIPNSNNIGRKISVKRINSGTEKIDVPDDEKLLPASEYESYRKQMFDQIEKLLEVNNYFSNNLSLYQFIDNFLLKYKNYHWKNAIKMALLNTKQKFGFSSFNINYIIKGALHEANDHSPIGHFWYICWKLSNMGESNKILGQHSNTQKWNNLLRKLGYTGFADKSGRGLIHPSEPIQAFFLQKDVVQHVETVLNKDYDVEYINFKNAKNVFMSMKNNKDVSYYNANLEYKNDLQASFKYKNLLIAIIANPDESFVIYDTEKAKNMIFKKDNYLKDITVKKITDILDKYIKNK